MERFYAQKHVHFSNSGSWSNTNITFALQTKILHHHGYNTTASSSCWDYPGEGPATDISELSMSHIRVKSSASGNSLFPDPGVNPINCHFKQLAYKNLLWWTTNELRKKKPYNYSTRSFRNGLKDKWSPPTARIFRRVGAIIWQVWWLTLTTKGNVELR